MQSIYLGLFIVLSAIGVYLWRRYKEDRTIVWAAVLVVCAGFSGLQMLLEKDWLPYAVAHDAYPSAAAGIVSLLNIAIHTLPYAFGLMLFLAYNHIYFSRKWTYLLVFAPASLSFVFLVDYSRYWIHANLIALWGLIFLAAIVYLAIRPMTKEAAWRERLVHIFHAVIFIVPLVLLNIYQFSKHSGDFIITLIPYALIGSALLIGALYVRELFLGIQWRSAQNLQLGTGLMHHSLKNSIGKVKLNALHIRRHLQAANYAEAERHVDNLLQTHDSLMNMMSRISHAVNRKKEIHVREENISALIEEVLLPYEKSEAVRLSKHLPDCVVRRVDRALVIECFQNIVSNAIEAMDEPGTLTVTVQCRKRQVAVSFKDTGIGMTRAQMKRMYEAFYSTKQRSGKNFGLGMYFVQHVMALHKGKVEVASVPGRGTTVTLLFK